MAIMNVLLIVAAFVGSQAAPTTTTTGAPVDKCNADRITFSESLDFCESSGQRLCTQSELKIGQGQGTGCNLDYRLVWTSSLCNLPSDGSGRIVELGAGGSSTNFTQYACQETDSSVSWATICCQGPIATPRRSTQPTTAAPEDCAAHRCADNCGCAGRVAQRTCPSDCGWSSKNNRCQLGSRTRLDELSLGYCGTTTTDAPVQSTTLSPSTTGPSPSPTWAPSQTAPNFVDKVVLAPTLQCNNQIPFDTSDDSHHDILGRTHSDGFPTNPGSKETYFRLLGFVAPVVVTIDTCDSLFDTILSVVEIVDSSNYTLLPLRRNDDGAEAAYTAGKCRASDRSKRVGGALVGSYLEILVLPGREYLVVVEGRTRSDFGAAILTTSCTNLYQLPETPDIFPMLPFMTCNGTQSVTGSTTGPVNNLRLPRGVFPVDYYGMELSVSQTVSIDTCSDDTDYNTHIFVLRRVHTHSTLDIWVAEDENNFHYGACGSNAQGVQQSDVVSSNGSRLYRSSLTLSLPIGQYLIVVGGTAGYSPRSDFYATTTTAEPGTTTTAEPDVLGVVTLPTTTTRPSISEYYEPFQSRSDGDNLFNMAIGNYNMIVSCSTGAPTISPTVSPSSSPTVSPTVTPTSQPTSADAYCAQFRCGGLCAADTTSANCGWNSGMNKCVGNEVTTVQEYGRGLCHQLCEEISCGNYCRGPCGWSKRFNKCKLGGFTQSREERMGQC